MKKNDSCYLVTVKKIKMLSSFNTKDYSIKSAK